MNIKDYKFVERRYLVDEPINSNAFKNYTFTKFDGTKERYNWYDVNEMVNNGHISITLQSLLNTNKKYIIQDYFDILDKIAIEIKQILNTKDISKINFKYYSEDIDSIYIRYDKGDNKTEWSKERLKYTNFIYFGKFSDEIVSFLSNKIIPNTEVF